MRVFIADNQSKVRFALGTLLRQRPDCLIVGEAANTEELLTGIDGTRPELLLLHWQLQGLPTGELMPVLRTIQPGLHIIVLSAKPEARREALSAGANAFVSKIDQPERLLEAIAMYRADAATLPALEAEQERER